MNSNLRQFLVALVVLALGIGDASAHTVAQTTNSSVVIATGNTFQAMFAAITANNQRKSLTIENNNSNADDCLVLIGGPFVAGDLASTSRTVNGSSMTAAQAAIRLKVSGSYIRYYPYIPNDAIVGTCTTTSDSIYADVQ